MLSPTVVGESYTAMSRRTRRAIGSCNNCATLCRFPVATGTSYSTADAKFGSEVFEFLEESGIRPIRTTARSPWQNGIAERWVGSARRELLDHVIPLKLNEQHLRRLGREYLAYYHEDRTHIGLEKTTPARRPVEACLNHARNALALPRIGGLHHRYTWSQVA